MPATKEKPNLRDTLKRIEKDYLTGHTKTAKAQPDKAVMEKTVAKNAARAKEIVKASKAPTPPAKKAVPIKKGLEVAAKAVGKAKLMPVDMEEDAKPPAPSNKSIHQITQMCADVADIDQAIEELNEKLALRIAHRKELTERDIPEAMRAAGLINFTLEDGSRVEVVTSKHGSYTQENEAKVFEWLRKNGHGSIIKNVIAVQFGKGEDEKAKALIDILMKKKYTDWAQKESVHANTFKAFVREQLEKGTTLPKLIAIFDQIEAKITKAKNGKDNSSSKDTGKNSSKASSKASGKGQDKF